MVFQKQCHAHIATYVVEIFKHNKVLYTHIGREKLLNLANCEPFTKIFLINIHRYTKNAFGICTDCNLFATLFHPNSFYLYGSPNVSNTKIFPCTVVFILLTL